MNINSRRKNLISSCLTGFYDSLSLFSLSVAVGVCCGFSVWGAAVTAIVCLVFGIVSGCTFSPSWLTVLPVFCLAYRFGTGPACIATALSGVFIFLLSKFSAKKFLSSEIKVGFIIASALYTTALQTTNYFGIGASGADAVEIIKDYISLGFHGNWRGVLYGTIVLVIMITYPKKFKNFSKKVPASFVSIAATLVMNLFLNPDRDFTAINEIEEVKINSLLNNAFFKGNFSIESIPLILCTSISIALVVTEFYPIKEKILLKSCVNTVGGIFGAVPTAPLETQKRSVFESVVCAVFCMMFFFLCPSLFERIPFHSLAVILIVGAWQSVEWSQIGKAFKGGRKSTILFILATFVSFVAGTHYAVLMLVILSVAISVKSENE